MLRPARALTAERRRRLRLLVLLRATAYDAATDESPDDFSIAEAADSHRLSSGLV